MQANYNTYLCRLVLNKNRCLHTSFALDKNCLFSGEALELSDQYTGSGTPDIVTLRHPNTGESAVFLFSPANNSVQEVLTFNEGKRSWFIDETVKSDGKLHLSTPIDPIFLGKYFYFIVKLCFHYIPFLILQLNHECYG